MKHNPDSACLIVDQLEKSGLDDDKKDVRIHFQEVVSTSKSA